MDDYDSTEAGLADEIRRQVDMIAEQLSAAADQLTRAVRRGIRAIGQPGTPCYAQIAASAQNTVRGALGNLHLDALTLAAYHADQARMLATRTPAQVTADDADKWRDIAADLFAEFGDEPVRIGTYVNQPPHTNGDPVMVHKARLTPETYAEIAHKLG